MRPAVICFWLARWLRTHEIEAYIIHPSVFRCHASTGGQRQIDSTPTSSSAPFSAGCAPRRATARWRRSRRSKNEDARRPNREHQSLVGERTRVVNWIKANLARLGICDFSPTLARSWNNSMPFARQKERSLPPNTLAELRREMALLRFVKAKSRGSRRHACTASNERPEKQTQCDGPLLALCRRRRRGDRRYARARRCSRPQCSRSRALARYAGLTGAPDEAEEDGGKKGSLKRVMLASAAG